MQWNGATYAANSEPQYRSVSGLIAYIVKPLNNLLFIREAKETFLAHCILSGGEKILDVGCGDGRVTAHIAAKLTELGGGSVIGVDLSPSQIEHAKKSHQAPNLRFQVCTSYALAHFIFSFTNSAFC